MSSVKKPSKESLKQSSFYKRLQVPKDGRTTAEDGSCLLRIPKTIGRPRKFTPTRLRNKINDYFAWCEKKDRYPNIKGLALHIGITRDQWYQYEKYIDFQPIIQWARDAMESWSMDNLWKTKASNTNKQLVAKVNHNWQEEKAITHTVISKDQAMAKLEALAPLLLEMLREKLGSLPELDQLEAPKEQLTQEAVYDEEDSGEE